MSEPEISIRIIDESQPSDVPTVDAASVEQFHDVKDEQSRRAHEDRAFLAYLFSLPTGRRFLWTHLQQFHPFETKFGVTPLGMTDDRSTWYQHGLQQEGLRLYQTWLVTHTAEVALMHRENDVRLMPAPEKKTRQKKASHG